MTDQFTTVKAPLTEAQGAALISANPVQFIVSEEDHGVLALPPGWTHTGIEPNLPAPVRQTGNHVTRSAAGFAALVESLAEPAPDSVGVVGFRLTRRDDYQLKAVINPGTCVAPAFDDLTVCLAPTSSPEISPWAQALAMPLAAWEQFVEDHAIEIDAAANVQKQAPTSADVLNDARNWVVESRRTVSRLKTETERSEADEYKATIVGKALPRLFIAVPVLQHGPVRVLSVRIVRDLDNSTIRPVITGWAGILTAEVNREIAAAGELLNATIIA